MSLGKNDHLEIYISKIVNDFVKNCSSKLSTEVRCIILYGSIARKDYVVGWSDIDILVVLKNNKNNFSNMEKLRKVCEITSKKYEDTDLKIYFFTDSICEKVLTRNYIGDIGVHLLVYNEEEINALPYQDFPPLFLYALQKDMKCLVGTNVFERLDLPYKITPEMLLNSKMGLYELRVRLRNTIINNSFNDNSIVFARDAIYCIFSAARNSLLLFGKDEFKTNKKEIKNNFIKLFSDFKHKEMVNEAYEFRANFPRMVSNKEYVKNFYKRSLMFIDSLISYIKERW